MNTCRCPGMEVTPPKKKEKNFRFKKVLGIELLTLLTLLGCAF